MSVLTDILQGIDTVAGAPRRWFRAGVGLDPRGSAYQDLSNLGMPRVPAAWLGSALDVLGDPTQVLAGGLASAAKEAQATAVAQNALRDTRIAGGAMPQEIANLTKAVDETGTPLRTFHGTQSAFNTFAPSQFGQGVGGNALGRGIYVTTDPAAASNFSYAARPSDRVLRELTAQRDYAQAQLLRNDPISLRPDVRAYNKARLADLQQRLSEWKPSGPNVRSQFLDVRNPLDLAADVGPSEIQRILDQPDIQAASPDLRGELERLKDFASKGQKIAGETVFGTLIRGDEDLTNPIWSAGYDAIKSPDQVWVASNPSQIYAPLVAPALQSVPSGISPLSEAIRGVNLAHNFGRMENDYGSQLP